MTQSSSSSAPMMLLSESVKGKAIYYLLYIVASPVGLPGAGSSSSQWSEGRTIRPLDLTNGSNQGPPHRDSVDDDDTMNDSFRGPKACRARSSFTPASNHCAPNKRFKHTHRRSPIV